jgi:hypothetical protein
MRILSSPLVIEAVKRLGQTDTHTQTHTNFGNQVTRVAKSPIFPIIPETSTVTFSVTSGHFSLLPDKKPSQQYRERALKQLELRRGSQYSQHPLASPVSDSVYLVYLRMIESVCQEMDKEQSAIEMGFSHL